LVRVDNGLYLMYNYLKLHELEEILKTYRFSQILIKNNRSNSDIEVTLDYESFGKYLYGNGEPWMYVYNNVFPNVNENGQTYDFFEYKNIEPLIEENLKDVIRVKKGSRLNISKFSNSLGVILDLEKIRTEAVPYFDDDSLFSVELACLDENERQETNEGEVLRAYVRFDEFPIVSSIREVENE
jgi:hypothetical protein